MRPVRPTLKALKQLANYSDAAKQAWDEAHRKYAAGEENPLFGLTLSQLDDELLRSASKVSAEYVHTNPHKAASQAAGRNVYEIRAAGGLRAALIFDEEGDPWVVFAASHDEFHSQVAGQLQKSHSSDWLPKNVDYVARTKEEAIEQAEKVEVSLIQDFFEAVKCAVSAEGGTVECSVPTIAHTVIKYIQLSITVDASADFLLEESGREEGLLLLDVSLTDPGDTLAKEGLLRLVNYLQPDESKVDFRQGCDYQTYHVEAWLTEARIAQIVAATVSETGVAEAVCQMRKSPPAQAVLHYTDKTLLAQGLVLGRSVRGLCGKWFVPTQDESCGKSVCPHCEGIQPVIKGIFQSPESGSE
ncbi:hypothetical protein KIMH_01880 [Bombiscardovia apis]|uniref:DUF3039 domain-containing protein n=1 Tax=Bombiscardovia apis TaxID=2932182 RepID=A0ABN6SFN8_9BIFI|nr:DUF3039 domain-containing protein [Bombiscardovia apis]BDR54077.1 hypothetical protein KIMH_01880 [Bombiscardovia apis]